jgi:hypothetical protein
MHCWADVSARFMSKKKQRKPGAVAGRVAGPLNGRRTGPIAAPTLVNPSVSETPGPKDRTRWPVTLVLVLLSTITAAVIGSHYLSNKPAVNTPSQRALSFPLQAGNSCKRVPDFVSKLNLPGSKSLSTAERDALGFAVISSDPQSGQRLGMWQHPSWRSAGNLTSIASDRLGDVYVIPAPRINLRDNPFELQNTLYKIDHESGEMRAVLRFPVARKLDARNPYAGLGLYYDCAFDSLFLSSVAGSDSQSERGSIFRIALRPEVKIVSTYQGFDALSVASAIGQNGVSVLLLGHARSSDVFTLALDTSGNFIGAPTKLLSLFGLGPNGAERAKKFEFGGDGALNITGAPFSYNLAQPPTQWPSVHYRFVCTDSTSCDFESWR